MIADTILGYQAQGMTFMKGQLSFMKDPATLSKMNLKSIQKPEIQNITASAPDQMDDIAIKQNLFFQIKDRSIDSDLAIIPIELNFHFKAKFRRGIQLRYGWTQEMKSSFTNVTL